MVEVQATKKCSKCHKVLILDKFYPDRRATRPPNSVRAACKVCQEAERREPERYRLVLASQHRRYYSKPMVKRRKENREGLLRDKYDLTLAEYDVMLESQGGGCAICGKTSAENGKHLSVDHDHETGEARGLLCVQCNSAIGFLDDNPRLCRLAAQYLDGG